MARSFFLEHDVTVPFVWCLTADADAKDVGKNRGRKDNRLVFDVGKQTFEV